MVCENVAVIARFRPPTAAESEERGCSTCARFEGTDAVSLELHDNYFSGSIPTEIAHLGSAWGLHSLLGVTLKFSG